jgi:hypothetical protein
LQVIVKSISKSGIYSDFEYFNDNRKQKQNIEMFTPVKAVKGQSEQERLRKKAYDDLFFTAVSKVSNPQNHSSTGWTKKQLFKERKK